jgi:phospholipid-translocating ATPase
MSDIRLNTLKYTALASNDDTSDFHPTPDMRASVRAAASASTSRLMKKAARRQDRYTDDPEEEAGLLAPDTYDEEQAYDEQERRIVAEIEPVRSPLLYLSPVHPMSSTRNGVGSSRAAQGHLKIYREQYPFDHQVRTLCPPAACSLPVSEKFQARYPPNIVRNQKYNIFTFLPIVFYEQFKFFFNLYFLLVALSQFIPALKIGFILTYIAPLAFVLCVTMGKEVFDDYKRNLRDREANSQKYLILDPPSTTDRSSALDSTYIDAHANTRAVPSSSLRVGDLIRLEKNQRVPADLVLLHTSDAAGTCFIRTDQLDGETDWKLRVAVPECQKLEEGQLATLDAEVYGAHVWAPNFCPANFFCPA